ncbi:MAG: hypothetical protein NTY77_07045 [Elusimicrobia bacterium]|nr:hypothetical protein [Elusimicrobiota bacterium]
MAEESILIVCGEPARAGLVKLWLEAAGYRNLRLAGSGAEALVLAQSQPPDCFLLDGDPELCRRLRASPALCRIPVVMLCACRSEEALGLQSGADCVVRRSDRPDELLAALAAALRRPQASPPGIA